MFRKDRIISDDRSEHGGGLIVYVKDGINSIRRYDKCRSRGGGDRGSGPPLLENHKLMGFYRE